VSDESSNPFEIPIVVTPDDIDEMDHVNNIVYLRWMQDVALAHWRSRATPKMLAELAWVATRHELDYLRAAVLGDAITARTWVGGVDSRRFERLTEIVRASDGVVLARGRTLWFLVSRATGRITRISSELRVLFSLGGLASRDAGDSDTTSG
jgi:acyl-CoA thioester hydrolase